MSAQVTAVAPFSHVGAAQPGPGLLRQVSGLVANLPDAPVAETRGRLRHAWRYHGGITWPDPGRYAYGCGLRGEAITA
jgi:hypothetical protein